MRARRAALYAKIGREVMGDTATYLCVSALHPSDLVRQKHFEELLNARV